MTVRYICVLILIALVGCSSLGVSQMGAEPTVKIEPASQYCNGAVLLQLFHSQYYKGNKLKQGALSYEAEDQIYIFEFGGPVNNESGLVFCLPEYIVEKASIGISYGEDYCAGFVDNFSLTSIFDQAFEHVSIRTCDKVEK